MLLQIPETTPLLTDSIPSIREEAAKLSTLSFDELMSRLVSTAVTFAINLCIAILVF